MNQDDFRKILATPRTTPGATAPALFRRPGRGGGRPGSGFDRGHARTIRREGRSDALERSHVGLGAGFVDRARDRRLAELRGESEQSGEVKGLDFELLRKVKSGEFSLPTVEVREGEHASDEEDEEAILDELLRMEQELAAEQEAEKMEMEKRDKDKDSDDEEERETQPEPAPETAASRFKPIVDAKVLKQLRREQKRRKMAMEGMDRLTKPMPPPPPPSAPKRSRAELLAELRRIQAAKQEREDSNAKLPQPAEKEQPSTVEKPPTVAKNAGPSNTTPFPEPSIVQTAKLPSQSPPSPRKDSPPPRVKVGDNMFSDESELSDYNPYNSDSDSDAPPFKSSTPTASSTTPVKRNYFGDSAASDQEPPKPTKLVTMDPAMAALLRKAAALAEKHGVPDEPKEDPQSSFKRVALGGSGGLYEFDEEDTWDGDLDEDVSTSRKKRRKEPKKG